MSTDFDARIAQLDATAKAAKLRYNDAIYRMIKNVAQLDAARAVYDAEMSRYDTEIDAAYAARGKT